MVLRKRRLEDRPARPHDIRVHTEFDLPTPNATPIGIVEGPDGAFWFAEKTGNKIGRITTGGTITEFPLPTPNAGPDAMMAGPDGNIWFSQTEVSQIGVSRPTEQSPRSRTASRPAASHSPSSFATA